MQKKLEVILLFCYFFATILISYVNYPNKVPINMSSFQIFRKTYINWNDIEAFHRYPYKMQYLQKILECTKDAFKFKHLSPPIRKFPSFNWNFFADLSFVYQEQTALFYESKVDFHGLSKEIPNNIKKLRFVRFLPIFSILIFSAQMQTSGKVFVWLNSNYECQ